ncbi:MAG: polysaccharide biosynthesis protein GtrA [Rhodobacteraceae bacterium]|nr:MAG: polysaccharide biosynthesis protein GtrA [Paracoccaceae bacterium]
MSPPETHPQSKPEGIGLAIRYAAFAAIASVANLATQRLVFAATDLEIRLLIALVAGTGVGLVLKYVLDKKWIFFDAAQPLAAESRKFSLYTLTGIATTLIFWGAEALFWQIWQTQVMRETGAVLGLTAGYFIKYQLDRRFVFATAGPGVS